MLEETYKVRFCETDALAHVSNTVIVQWFEAAREPLFRLFIPDMDVSKWSLILASYSVDFLQQLFLGEVTIKTGLKKIGNSSFVVHQEVWQKDVKCSEGQSTMVHFDYLNNKAVPIPDSIRAELSQHLIDDE